MSTDDRRAQGATRVPFEALVEVGGALGPSFEAQAVNISEDGMHLRTAYLPEIGQPLSCRFDAGGASSVLVCGEVVWTQEQGRGGEFGIRFADLDPQSAEALARLMGVADEPPPPQQMAGSRIRLHIDGLGSPMRARVRDSGAGAITAFSELGFLQVGKSLELEDAKTGMKRPAHIDKVEVQIDPESHVPQLVVALRYDDEQARMEEAQAGLKETTPEPHVIHEEMEEDAAPEAASTAGHHRGAVDSIEAAGHEMRGAFARGAAKVTPALMKAMNQAKTTIALLAAKRRGGSGDDVAVPLRRRTSPAPGGGLHTSGRKVVRGESLHDAKAKLEEEASKPKITPKRIAIGGAVGVAVILAFVAMRKPPAPPVNAAAGTSEDANGANAAVAPLTATTAESPNAPPASVMAPVGPVNAMPAATPAGAAPTYPAQHELAGASDVDMTDSEGSSSHAHKKLHVAPFTNGPVQHGNVLRLKMDGAIETIEGAAQPTGFTVVIPARRSLEAAGPLAARDGRIASIRVSNDGSGAELTVAFKDGVPNYVVRAHGDVLEIVLAAPGSLAAPAPKGAPKHDVASAPKHPKHPKH